MHVEWSLLPRGDVAPHWSHIYVTLNSQGTIAINKVAYQRMGEPAAFQIYFDKVNSRIALKPTAASMKHAYPAPSYGRRGGRRIRAYRLITEYGIKIDETIEFKDAEVDPDGLLILDLRTARASLRARGQLNRRAKSES